MEINNSKPVDMITTYAISQSVATPVSAAPTERERMAAAVNNSSGSILPIKDMEPVTGLEKKTDAVNKENLDYSAKELNKFLATFTADLHFSIHERTQRLMVQLVNTKENKVIKEFPPKEFLDMIANIQECVGAILDKKV